MENIESKLRNGRYYELLETVNVIPAGIYKFTGIEDDFLTFKVGVDIIFGLSLDCISILKPVTFKKALRRRISRDDFLVSYSGLCKKNVGKHDPFARKSFCAMSEVGHEIVEGLLGCSMGEISMQQMH